MKKIKTFVKNISNRINILKDIRHENKHLLNLRKDIQQLWDRLFKRIIELIKSDKIKDNHIKDLSNKYKSLSKELTKHGELYNEKESELKKQEDYLSNLEEIQPSDSRVQIEIAKTKSNIKIAQTSVWSLDDIMVPKKRVINTVKRNITNKGIALLENNIIKDKDITIIYKELISVTNKIRLSKQKLIKLKIIPKRKIKQKKK